NLTVTLKGCNEFCGPPSRYWDTGPRITTWIIPVLLLLSNIELSPIDKKRFMTVVHALGDPIDSFWSLIHKIYIWHRLYLIGLSKSPEVDGTSPAESISDSALATVRTRHERARIIATVLAGFEEISGAKINSEDYYHMILYQLGRIGEEDEDKQKFKEWCHAARVLADARTNEFLRTCLAIFVYIFGLIAAFIPSVGGGNTSPPGGRIGSALYLSWLVPLALLSNVIGGFTSRRTCLTIMRIFLRLEALTEVKTTLIDKTPWDGYFGSLQWLGAIYTYRPWKVLYLDINHTTHSHRRNVIMVLSGVFPIAVSMIGAFVIIWYAVPVGFSCRHSWVIGIFVLWILSVTFTSLLYIYFKSRY
ncbi:uncharacterized protein K441DRAFT_440380, partial [Cenococcum geophilum 1.58]|uniref:uncharacterized protein n=1 Tax=Cenococcum geophilum 1.58 TaxID=794803 RepID=UPI0035901003